MLQVKFTLMEKELEETLTSREVLLYAAAVVWSQRRMQRHLNMASANMNKHLKAQGVSVKSF